MNFRDTQFNAKSSFTSITTGLNTTMEQEQISGEDNSNYGLDAILVC